MNEESGPRIGGAAADNTQDAALHHPPVQDGYRLALSMCTAQSGNPCSTMFLENPLACQTRPSGAIYHFLYIRVSDQTWDSHRQCPLMAPQDAGRVASSR